MIKTRNLQGAATTTPPIDALGGGRPALAHRVHSTHVQVDCLLGNDRNVVARVGLHGASLFQVATGIDPDDFTQMYPLRSVARTAARVPPFAVLPGHLLRLTALVCPSGLTVKSGAEEGDNWIDDGAYGRIDVAITWTGSPGVVVTNHSVQLPTSSATQFRPYIVEVMPSKGHGFIGTVLNEHGYDEYRTAECGNGDEAQALCDAYVDARRSHDLKVADAIGELRAAGMFIVSDLGASGLVGWRELKSTQRVKRYRDRRAA